MAIPFTYYLLFLHEHTYYCCKGILTALRCTLKSKDGVAPSSNVGEEARLEVAGGASRISIVGDILKSKQKYMDIAVINMGGGG